MNPGPARVVVSVHDVSPATASESRRWVRDLDERGVPSSLLVIPGPWRGRSLAGDTELAAWLRSCRDRGHELCLHGWDHAARPAAPVGRTVVGNLVARGCAEFWTTSETEAAERVRRGLDVLAELDLETSGFTPPGGLISSSGVRGLRRAGLDYVTTHLSVTDLAHGGRVRAPVLCHRPASRGERFGAALMSRAPARLLHPGRTLRIALHPDDLLRPRLRDAALRGIDAALAGGAVAVTYLTLVEQGRRSAAQPGRPGSARPGYAGAVP
ncbi:MAG TPA: polysaccharide deacetylase family protein [Acidimicrobiales bacterium]|nr:polysaccharide deacetylase family protein [Acidimicrobiales bacterium]